MNTIEYKMKPDGREWLRFVERNETGWTMICDEELSNVRHFKKFPCRRAMPEELPQWFDEMGEKGKNINEDVASLVSKGLPTIVQQSLDVVRVTGNEAVHPGQIDTDDPAVVAQLFELLNIIVEYMIAMPKRVSGIYAGLPATAKDAIAKRDKS
jgi:hypothetical protein